MHAIRNNRRQCSHTLGIAMRSKCALGNQNSACPLQSLLILCLSLNKALLETGCLTPFLKCKYLKKIFCRQIYQAINNYSNVID